MLVINLHCSTIKTDLHFIAYILIWDSIVMLVIRKLDSVVALNSDKLAFLKAIRGIRELFKGSLFLSFKNITPAFRGTFIGLYIQYV
jgi:hypothetical protein